MRSPIRFGLLAIATFIILGILPSYQAAFAQGTIPLRISEFRLRGSGGGTPANAPTDEFVEIINAGNTPFTVPATNPDGTAGFVLLTRTTDATALSVVFTIPANTTFAARQHLLIAGTGYSLGAYGTPDVTLAPGSDLADNSGLGLFGTGTQATATAANKIDAVGFASTGAPFVGGALANAQLVQEGTPLNPYDATATVEHSFVRISPSPALTLQDTDNNINDFLLVSPTAAMGATANQTIALGMAGPEGANSPREGSMRGITIGLVPGAHDRLFTSGNFSATFPGATLGLFVFNRRITNNTASAVVVRFRVLDMTVPTGVNPPPATAAIIVLENGNGATTSDGSATNIQALALELSALQPNGGGINSSVATSGATIPVGGTRDVQFVLGVNRGGNYRFFVSVDALP